MSVTFSQYAQDFILYDGSFFDILEGTTGGGKSVDASFKFITKVYQSKERAHLICCQNMLKTEQNIISDNTTGIVAMFTDANGEKLVEYYPNGCQGVKSPHLRVHCPDFDKIIYFISYSDSTKSKQIRSGRYGCIFIDEINLVPNNEPDQVAQFITECLSRANDYVVATLNPDDPSLPLYSKLINKSRPIKKYKNKGPKQIRDLLDAPENKEYKWWFFDFHDNPSMTDARIKRIKESCEGNAKDWNSRILGLRMKQTLLAFPSFDDEKYAINKKDVKKRSVSGYTGIDKINFIDFYAGVDTSWSSKTDDLIALMFVGITDQKEVYVLDEWTYNNRDHTDDEKLSPSSLMPILLNFLSKNSKEWGYITNTYIDEADAGLISEINGYKRTHHFPFRISKSAKSKFKIPDRLKKVNELINNKKYWVCDHCSEHIRELNVMTLDKHDKNRIEDANNHTYDAICYALAPSFIHNKI